MKNLSLKLDEEIFKETELILARIKMSRNRYINEALRFYNKLQDRKKLASLLKYESELVGKESMMVMEEFERLHHDDPAV